MTHETDTTCRPRGLIPSPIQRIVLVVSLAVLLILILPVVPASSQTSVKPGVPSNVSATSENLEITVTWEATTETGVPAITDYYVDWTNLAQEIPRTYDNIYLNTDDTDYVIDAWQGSPLVGGHEYQVCVWGYNSIESDPEFQFSDFACVDVEAATTTVVVSEVSVPVRRGTTAEVAVSLDNPDLLSTAVRIRYRTAAVDGGQAGAWSDEITSTDSSDLFSFFLSGLTRGTTYEVEATTAIDFTSEGVVSTTFATVAGPVVLARVDFTIGTTTFDVTFSLDNPDSAIATVRLQFRTPETFGLAAMPAGEWSEILTKSTMEESIEFNLTGLSPNTPYELWTTTASDFGDEALVYRLAFRTHDSEAVTQAEASNITANSATVTATLFNPNSSSLEVFLRFRASSESIFDETTPSMTTTGTSVDFTLTGLTLGTQYQVQVSLDGSFATNFRETLFTTLDVPDGPTSIVVSADDGSLTVTWGLPAGDGGSPVTGYVVQWKVLRGEYAASNEIQVLATAAREVMIPSLNNHTTYVVRVLAVNAIGRGEGSGEVAGTPNTGAEVESVSHASIRDVSARVKVKTRYVATSNQSVWLRFRPILQPEAEWVRERGAVSDTNLEIEFLLTGLTPNTLYELQASLDSTFAAGVQQGADFMTNLLGMPVPPSAPRVNVSVGDERLSVSWSTRNDGGAEVTGFKLAWWSENTQALEVRLSRSHRNYVIRNLQNGTTYSVQVIATNIAGDSPPTVVSRTPSTVPGSQVTGLVALGCNGAVSLSWRAPIDDGGNPITGYRVQWKSGFETYRAERQAFVTSGLTHTVGSLVDGTEYTVRVLGVNANGGAADENATPLWSREVKTTPISGVCIAKLTFGNILSDSAPVIVEVPRAEEGTQVNMRYQNLLDIDRWSAVQSQTLAKSETIATFDIRGLKPSNFYEVEAWLGSQRPTEDRVARALLITGAAPPGATFTGGGGSQVGRILRIEPTITSVTVNAGDEVLLSVEIYGRQGLHDNGLADKHPDDERPVFTWSSDGFGSFSESDIRPDWQNGIADDREVRFTAPSHAGTFAVEASLDGTLACLAARDGETAEDQIARCSARIEVTVMARPERSTSSTTTPVNPPGPIPETLTDSEGVAYAVFTPVDGGSFLGDGYSLVAGPGAVADGEFIGVAMSRGDPVSDLWSAHHRYALAGDWYRISAIDGEGEPLTSYLLDEPARTCIPMPPELRSSISDVAVASVDAEGSQTILSTRVRITDEGVVLCAALSALPSRIAAAGIAAPEQAPVAEPSPDPAVESPDTGGRAPSERGLLLILMLGIAATIAALFIAAPLGAAGAGRTGTGDLHRRRGQPGIPDQRGD